MYLADGTCEEGILRRVKKGLIVATAPNISLNRTRNHVDISNNGLSAPVSSGVRHSAEVINKTKSIWVEVITRHTVPIEQDGLYGVKQLATVFLLEVNIRLKRI